MVPSRGVRFAILTIVVVLMKAAPGLAQQVAAVATNSTEVADGVCVLDGLPCNVLAVTGSDGKLLIDNGSAGSAEQLEEMIDILASGRVRVAVNTHFHFDHVGANEQLSEDGAVIVAHDAVRQRMQEEWRTPENTLGIRYPVVPPYPEEALPMVTFADSLTLSFGGHEIKLRYFPGAHSDADVVAFLRDANVIHTGDLYLSNGFPVIESFAAGL